MTLEDRLKSIRKELMLLYKENYDIRNEKYMEEILSCIARITKALHYLGAE